MVQRHDAAGTSQTIWTQVSEQKFIESAQKLSKNTSQVLEKPCVYNPKGDQIPLGLYVLPYKLEYQLVEDIAFIASHDEGAHCVSAATIEEQSCRVGINVTIATNSGPHPIVRNTIPEIGRLLEKCASKDLNISSCIQEVFALVVQLCERKLISRLKCKDWIPPRHNKKRPVPLHLSLETFVNRYRERHRLISQPIESVLNRLQHFIDLVTEKETRLSVLDFPFRLEVASVAATVCDQNSSLELVFGDLNDSDLKTVRAFDKLANYKRLCELLCRTAGSRKFRHLFESITFDFLEPYKPRRVSGHERHVHAEVQLATWHMLRKQSLPPRVIGTSKAACYLCNLFLSSQRQFGFSGTHGVIFDAWTVPDITSYSKNDRNKLRNLLRQMNQTMQLRHKRATKNSLPFPVQSVIFQQSLPSLVETVISSVTHRIHNRSEGDSHNLEPTNLFPSSSILNDTASQTGEQCHQPYDDELPNMSIVPVKDVSSSLSDGQESKASGNEPLRGTLDTAQDVLLDHTAHSNRSRDIAGSDQFKNSVSDQCITWESKQVHEDCGIVRSPKKRRRRRKRPNPEQYKNSSHRVQHPKYRPKKGSKQSEFRIVNRKRTRRRKSQKPKNSQRTISRSIPLAWLSSIARGVRILFCGQQFVNHRRVF